MASGAAPGKSNVYTLGVTRFNGDWPERSIVMYPEAIVSVVSAILLLRDEHLASSPLVRDSITGRVFGRALAHAIGHVLLRSRRHSRRGLMRPRPSSAALIGPDRRDFALSACEVAELNVLLRFSS